MKKWILAFIYCIIMRNFLKLIVGVKFVNKQVLKKEKQFIIVSNHNSHIDTMALLSILSSKQVIKTHPIAAGDYFGKSSINSFFSRYFANALLIPRKVSEGEKNPILLMGQALINGKSLILFPEGSRGEPEKMQSFKKGVGLLLKKNPEIPYIPVFMKGMGKVLPRGERLLVPFDTYVVFGEPKMISSQNIDEIIKEMEEAILELATQNTGFETQP
jgi:1-acyl-sn-glycerol-3-phosphate acyltransferase